ncbi:MAG TPA: YndJ family transporter, partial [Terriglobales bacterium]|nr:YndJ family transporter [Terriglobales bacterium]
MGFVWDEHRSMIASLTGASVWVILATLAGSGHAPLSVIELLLMFALLVIVPLGLELAPIVTDPGLAGFEQTARWLQPIAAACAVAAFWHGPGLASGLLVAPWFAMGGLVAASGLAGLSRSRSIVECVGNVARLDLGIAGGWLLVSRLGIPTGFQEPIVLLTAVHFHYSGFATALIAGSGARWTQGGRRRDWWEKTALAIALLPFAVAAGFVFSPTLRVVAVGAFTLAIVSLAVLLALESRTLATLNARIFLRTSATVVLVGILLAA